MKHQDLEAQAKAIRHALLETMGVLDRRKEEWTKTAAPAGYCRAQTALANPEYDVVICGEAKRGKSTLVNAILGRSLLPTGVSETTSQVFRVHADSDESYALVFEDGLREPISKEEMVRYGSQSAVQLEGLPMFHGRMLRWIEVGAPGAFLPAGIHLVDTPGLGALYASHAEVTHRYITRADAFVFVLDSSQPLTQQEMRFLEKAFAVSSNAMFVQTKIDQHGEEAWRAIQQRNEYLLNKAFPQEGRPPIRVYPMSSTLLFDAAKETDKADQALLLSDSLFEQVRSALEVLISRTTGWTRSAWAAAEASRYIQSIHRHLEEQRQMLEAETAAEKTALRQKKADIRATFQREWGPGGTKRLRYGAEVDNIAKGIRQSAYNLVAPGSDAHGRFLKEIQSLSTRESAEQYARDLPEKVNTVFNTEWQEAILGAQRMLGKLDSSMPMIEEGMPPISVDLPRLNLRASSVWDRIKATNIDGMIGGGLAALVADLFFTGGLVTAVTVAGAVLGGTQGFLRITSSQMEAARNEIRQHLSSLLSQCRNALCNPDLPHGRSEARLDSFLGRFRAQIEANVGEQYQIRQRRMEEEERKLDQQSALTGQKREVELKSMQKNLAELASLDERIKECIERLRRLLESYDRVES